MAKKRYRIEYTIEGMLTILPRYIVMEANSIDELDKIPDDSIKDIILEKDDIALTKGKESISLFR